MNLIFLIPLFVGGCIQGVKVLIDYIVDKKFQVNSLWSSGGFPSVHSGIAASICTIVLIKTGIESLEFALAITFSFLFRYDAANVRYEAGQHATFLNLISLELHELTESITKGTPAPDRLKERLGHTTTEVFGGILAGVLITLLILFIIH